MAYLEINCSNFTYEKLSDTSNYRIYVDLLQEDVSNLEEFTNITDLYIYIQYKYNLVNDVYDILFDNIVTFTDDSYSQTNPNVFVGLNISNSEYGKVQIECNFVPLEVKLILSTPDIEILTPTSDSKIIVSTNEGYSTIDYSFKVLNDLNSAKVFCKDKYNNNYITYYFTGLNIYEHLNVGTIISNTIDVREMFTELTPVNGKIYTIGIEVNTENRFYSYDWVEFILSDGQHMIVK